MHTLWCHRPRECTPRSPRRCRVGLRSASPGWGRALWSTSARAQGKRAPYPAKLAGTCGEQQLRAAVLASDVVLELFDDELLLGNNCLDEIANREDADQPPAVQDRQVTNPPLSYDGHAFLKALVQVGADHVGRHDVLERSLVGRTPLEDDFAGVVPF